jgi:hypothetical protein
LITHCQKKELFAVLGMFKSSRLTNGDAQAVSADEVLAAVAAGDLLAVAADGAVVLGRDVDLGVAGLLVGSRGGSSGLGGSDLGGGGGLAVAGSGGDESGHGGDEESLHEGHFVGWVGWLVGWWKLVVVVVGGVEASVLDWIGSG